MLPILHLVSPFCLAGLVLCLMTACRIDGHYDPLPMDAAPDAETPIAEWSTRYGGPGDDTGNAIAVASNGDIVATGTFTNTMTLGGPPISSAGGLDAWVARYKADGTFMWSTRFGGIGTDRGNSIAVDSNGDVYVVGNFEGPVNFGGGNRSAHGGFLVKLAGATGAYAWDRVVDASGYESTNAVTIIDADNIAIGGVASGSVNLGGGSLMSTPINSPDVFVAVYNATNGMHIWSKVLATSGLGDVLGGLTAVNGDVLVTGQFMGTGMLGGASLNSMGYDTFVARYRGTDGSHVWSMRHGGTSSEWPRAITATGNRVFVGGLFAGTTNLGGANIQARGSNDAFVAAYDFSDGTHIWSHGFGSSLADGVSSLSANPTRLAAVMGFGDTISIGTQTLTLSSGDSRDLAIIRLDLSTGEPRVASQFGHGSPGLQDDMVLSYTADRLAGVGTFSMSTKLFSVALRSDGGTDIAMFRVDF